MNANQVSRWIGVVVVLGAAGAFLWFGGEGSDGPPVERSVAFHLELGPDGASALGDLLGPVALPGPATALAAWQGELEAGIGSPLEELAAEGPVRLTLLRMAGGEPVHGVLRPASGESTRFGRFDDDDEEELAGPARCLGCGRSGEDHGHRVAVWARSDAIWEMLTGRISGPGEAGLRLWLDGDGPWRWAWLSAGDGPVPLGTEAPGPGLVAYATRGALGRVTGTFRRDGVLAFLRARGALPPAEEEPDPATARLLDALEGWTGGLLAILHHVPEGHRVSVGLALRATGEEAARSAVETIAGSLDVRPVEEAGEGWAVAADGSTVLLADDPATVRAMLDAAASGAEGTSPAPDAPLEVRVDLDRVREVDRLARGRDPVEDASLGELRLEGRSSGDEVVGTCRIVEPGEDATP